MRRAGDRVCAAQTGVDSMTVTTTILALCWAVFIIYWGVTALKVKRTLGRRADWLRVAIAIVVALGVATLRSPYGRSIDPFVLPRSLPAGVLSDLLAVAGVAVLLGGRTILGGNWSSAGTLKGN